MSSSIIQTSADLYNVSVTQWNAIQSLANSLSVTSAAQWAAISSVSFSVQTLSQTVDALSTDVYLLAPGISNVSSALALNSTTLYALSASVASMSAAHWAAIFNISANLQNNVSLSIAALSSSVNTTSITQWDAISSVSYATTTASALQWTALTSLSASLDNTSVQQWAAIQSVLPSVVGQTGKFLQATPTGTQWASLGGGGGGGGGYVTLSTALSVYTATAASCDVVVVVQDPSSTNISIILPSAISDGQTFVLKKGPSTIASAVLRVTAAGGTLIDGVSTPMSVIANGGFIAVTYSDKISAYVTTGQKWTDGGGIDPSIPFTFSLRSSPMAGNVVGVITGYYGSLSGALGVTLKGVSAASFTVTNASTMVLSTGPSAVPGFGDIAVYDSIGVSRTLSNYFEYLPYSGTVQNPTTIVKQVAITNFGTIFGFTDNNTLYRLTAKGFGSNFSLGSVPAHGPPTCERISGQVVLVPYTTPGVNYRYSLDGTTLQPSTGALTGATRFAVSPNGAYVLGAKVGGGFWYGTNILTGDIAFTQSPSFSTVTVQDICINNAGEAIGVVPGLSVFRSTDGGATWTQPVGAPADDFNACANGASYAYVCGRSTGMYRSSDSGATWTSVAGLVGYTFYAVACSANGMYVVACSNLRAIYVSYDYGVTFRFRMLTSSTILDSIGIATDGSYIVAGGGNNLAVLDL